MESTLESQANIGIGRERQHQNTWSPGLHTEQQIAKLRRKQILKYKNKEPGRSHKTTGIQEDLSRSK